MLLTADQLILERKRVRQMRRKLNIFALRRAEKDTLFHLLQHPNIQFKQHIGIYLDAFGEVPTTKLMLALFKQKKSVYLPLICPMKQTLRWQKISLQQWRNQRFAMHRLGMKQAMQSRAHAISHLDTVIMPLVLCDSFGHRVGMGGGFYDRTLAQAPCRPYRLGLAHNFQVSQLTIAAQPWDQSLDGLICPNGYLRFKRR